MKSDRLNHAEKLFNNELSWLVKWRHWIPDGVIKLTLKRLKLLRREIQILKDGNNTGS